MNRPCATVPLSGAVGIDVGPLVVAGGLREAVDLCLGELMPVGGPDLPAGYRTELVDAADD